MTAPALAAYTFLPWVQGGVGRSIAAPDEPNAALAARVTLPVSVHVDGAGDVPARRSSSTGPATSPASTPRRSCAATRRPARPASRPATCRRSSSRAPTCRGCSRPPRPGRARTRLRPWLVLVAVRRRTARGSQPGSRCPCWSSTTPPAELPDLVAVVGVGARARSRGLRRRRAAADVLANDPGARVLAARLPAPPGARHRLPRLPRARVLAPASRPGSASARRRRRASRPRGAPTPPTPLRLPVYDSWEFATGPAGSFETLVRRLHPAPLDPTSAQPPKLDLSAPGGGLPAGRRRRACRARCACPARTTPPPWPADARRSRPRSSGCSARGPGRPRAAGLRAAASRRRRAAGCRRAAGLAARAQPRPAAARRRRGRHARRAGAPGAADGARVGAGRRGPRRQRAAARRAARARARQRGAWSATWRRCRPPQLLAMTQPAHAQIALADATVDGRAARPAACPRPSVSGAMRRLASPQGLIARACRRATQPVNLLAAVDQVAMTPPPAPPGRDGRDGRLAAQLADVDDAAGAVRRRGARASCSSGSRRRRPCSRARRARVDAPAGTLDAARSARARRRPAPRFTEPMYDGLAAASRPWLFLPGVEDVEADGVALLETTPRVIEAYMAGLNHELSRELLWREFPASLAGTAFRQFWDVSGQPGDPETLADIPPISEWDDRRSARTCAAAAASSCCSCAASCCAATRRRRSTPPARRPPARSTRPPGWRRCSAARSPPDIVFVGFALSEEDALGIDPAGRAGTSSSSSTRASRASASTRSPPPASRRPRTRSPGRTCRSRASGHADVSQAAHRRRQPAGAVGQERGRHGVADLPAAVPRRDARVAPDREERLMTDLAAIAAARAKGRRPRPTRSRSPTGSSRPRPTARACAPTSRSCPGASRRSSRRSPTRRRA